jgi:uncharacterized protein
MTEEICRDTAAFMLASKPGNTGIVFYGGEPLLRTDLIFFMTALLREAEKAGEHSFHFRVTTNGLALDEDFLGFAESCGLAVSLSIDGMRQAHDRHRKTASGEGTFKTVDEKIDLLLKWQPYAQAMTVVTPETLPYYCDSVSYLFERGFRYVIVALDYSRGWEERHLGLLREQYGLLADLYRRLTADERKFYFSPFDIKIASHIHGGGVMCERCHGGERQVSVAPDGSLYPCVSFVQDCGKGSEFRIGDIWNGFDEEKRRRLYGCSQSLKAPCRECALRDRCNNRCSCVNWQSAGQVDCVSPVLCETERILFPVADSLAESLYSSRAPMFIQKHYNPAFPVISLLEDMQSLR